MKFSMNDFRRQLSGDVENLRDIAAAIVAGERFDKEEFVEAVNAVITKSNVLNCVFVKGDEDFTDMNELEVEHLEGEAA